MGPRTLAAGLPGPQGVGEQHAPESDQVRVALLDHRLGSLGRLDPARRDHGGRGDGTLHRRGERHQEPLLAVVLLVGRQGERVVAARHDRQVVDADSGERARERDRVGERETTRDVLIREEPIADRKVRADRLPHGEDDVERKSHPALRVAAVRVGPQIGARRKELRQQVAGAAVQLDHVEAGLLGTAGARREGGDNRLDVGLVHGLRRRAEGVDGRRSDPVRPSCVASGVVNLEHGHGPLALDARREPREAWHEAVLRGEQGARQPEAARLDRRVLDHDHPDPGGRCLAVVVEHEVVHLVVLVRIGEVHGEADQAVPQRDVPDREGGEEKASHARKLITEARRRQAPAVRGPRPRRCSASVCAALALRSRPGWRARSLRRSREASDGGGRPWR